MTQKDRNIHSYSAEVWIEHKGVLYNPTVEEGLTITLERKGVPGKCEFSVVKEEVYGPDGAISIHKGMEFEEGDHVRVKISKTWLFYGFIFTKSRDAENRIKYTCYDQLRYLQNKETYVLTNKSVGEVVKLIAKDFNLNLGVIRDSKYKIPSIIQEGTLFDTILYCMEETTKATGEIFILYDRFGKLTLCPLKHMGRNVIIDNSVIENYQYMSTIDKQSYNQISLKYKQANGVTESKVFKNQESINQWGVLQHVEEVRDYTKIEENGKALLKYLNTKTRTLKIDNAMGAVELVGGAMCMVDLDLGDIKLKNNMIVDYIQHKVEDGFYSMSLELIGGEFVSTRGKSGSSNGKKKSDDSGNSTGVRRGAKDWGHGVTAEMMNKVLKGPLAGMGQRFIELGNAYGVNPMIVAMMIRIESRPTMNSGLALRGNNFGGINWTPSSGYPKIVMGGRAYNKYPSVDVGIEEQFRLLGVKYLHDWKKRSIRDIIMTYAPPSENNSSGYIANLKNFYEQNTGVKWNENLLGPGVASKEAAHNNMNRVEYTDGGVTAPTDDPKRQAVVQEAMRHLGTTYVWGGFHPGGFDCSGLMMYSFKKALGVNLPRVSSDQARAGRYVSRQNLKPGDMIFWGPHKIHHVGMYIGDGKYIHAPQPGDHVRISKLGAYTTARSMF